MPTPRRFAFAFTALAFVVACSRGIETAPSAPSTEAAPASAAAPPPPAEAPAPSPAAAPFDAEGEASDRHREEALKAPAKRDELGEALAELERARTELDSALAPRATRPAATAGSGASRDADASRAPAAPPPKAEKKSSESSCSTACRAFTSLERAASAVCRLAGEKDARCTHAHDVLADAQKRVTVCGCQAG